MNRDELLEDKVKVKNDRIPLVITWYHHLKDLPNVIHKSYSNTVKRYSEFGKILPKPPIIAFRRPTNIFLDLFTANIQHLKRTK